MFNTTSLNNQRIDSKVLSQTYALLGLSLIPTILGTYLGMVTGLYTLFSGFIGLILFFVAAYGLIYFINKNKNSVTGIVLLFVFTGFMGMLLSGPITRIMQFSNGMELISAAVLGTSGILLIMSYLSKTIKKDLSVYGKGITIAIWCMIFAGLLNFVFQMPLISIVLSVASIIIFSIALLISLQSIKDGKDRNYIMATLDIYLSLFNIFISLLNLLGIFGGKE